MNTADDLISGYTAYTDAADFGASAAGESPAITPSIISFATASSPECAVFAVSVASGVVTSVSVTNAAGC